MMRYPLRRSCREAAALILAREDRALRPLERVALRLHLAVCKACPNFAQEITTMRDALKAWRSYRGDD